MTATTDGFGLANTFSLLQRIVQHLENFTQLCILQSFAELGIADMVKTFL